MRADVDVVVVGTGAAGLTGALRAATRGLRVLVLEKDDVVGGTAALTGGGLWAPTNTWLQQAGMADSLEDAQTYLDSTVGERTPRWKQQAFLNGAVAVVDWLATLGVRFARLQGFPDYAPDQPGGRIDGRAIAPKTVKPDVAATVLWPLRQKLPCGDGGPPMPAYDLGGLLVGGRALVGQLLLACAEAGVEIWTSCALLELVVEEGRVVGVVSERGEISSPAGVLLATGGFEHNPAMRAEHQLPFVREGRWSLGVAGNTGDGHRVGLGLGAATDLLEDAWWTPAFQRPDGPSFLLWDRIAPLGFVVDQNGQRWGNEGMAYNEYGQHMRLFPERLPSYQVFDARGLSRYGFAGLRPDQDPTPWVEAGCLRRSETIEGLGIPGLVETTSRWNALAHKGVDEDFGRGSEGSFERQLLAVFLSYGGLAPTSHEFPNPSLAPVDDGPFFAAPVVLGDLGTKGGLVTDDRARVLREDGSVIGGLFAVGNTAASVMGHTYPGPGSCITPGMAFAMAAADTMVET
ncbi:MAG: 3-ketosteroid-delta-dehydrogenase [Frankiales bacterium]|nr:3-ketosteroid-delta-dehydrogenase [Frankiales bacterium]